MKLKITIALLLIVQLTFGQDRVKRVDSLLNAMYAQQKINGNYLIAEKGTVIYQKSFGLANEETKEPLNENSIFELASVSKQFTAMAIAILHENGKLNINDKMSKYIPELAYYDNITIKNLVHHTSGLPDYMELMETRFDKNKIATNDDIVTLLAKEQPKLLFDTNTKWEYSNTGYALLATIIEKASGMSYADYLQKNLFTPLKMTNTFVYTRRYAPKKVSNYAYGYVYSDELKKLVLPDDLAETKMVVWLDGIVGDGTVNSTANDLLLWDRALYTNQLLSKSGMEQVFKSGALADGSATKYGFGWFIENNPDYGKMASHSGGWPGYKTYIDRHLDNDKTIIILSNHEKVAIPINSLRSILYNKPLPTKKERKEIALTNEQLQKFIGVYEIQPGFEITVTSDKDQLLAQLTGQNAFPIFAENETQFFLKVVDAQIHFVPSETGAITGLVLLQNGNTIEGKRIK
ncbi:serine hydrolase [Flavobacterium buctense]|uniref:Serine hydrolase n=1 Tax=Flavobacterium buctense TaxID=1648146 RepID=A0ABU9DYT0_9FLAO|nr:serine hydrolase [Flavobacterium buctense]